MKIYTKTGDAGETSLFGGKRIAKNDIRLHAYGSVDELNASVGFVVSLLAQQNDSSMALTLEHIQHHLFTIGSHLSTPYLNADSIPDSLPPLSNAAVLFLEHQIDSMEKTLPQLTHFILPGGTSSAAALHIARTICRRTERYVIELQEHAFVLPEIIQYLNRLSDFLFVAARFVNAKEGAVETPWKKDL